MNRMKLMPKSIILMIALLGLVHNIQTSQARTKHPQAPQFAKKNAGRVFLIPGTVNSLLGKYFSQEILDQFKNANIDYFYPTHLYLGVMKVSRKNFPRIVPRQPQRRSVGLWAYMSRLSRFFVRRTFEAII